MTTTTPVTDTAAPAEVASYVEAVAAHLASLPWLSETDRADLLDDLTQHLSEVAAEEGPSLVERLGPPAAYGEELVAAAGLEAPAATAADRLTFARVQAALAGNWERLQRAVAEAGDLRPAWWILRGYLAASLLGAVTGGGHHGAGHPGFPVPAVFGSRVVGLLAVAAAVRISLRWGQQGRPARRWLRRAAGGGLAVYGVVLVSGLGDGRGAVQWVDSALPIGNPGCLVNGAGQVIENLYPYDAEGRLLERVLLYDQTGRPLDNLCPSDYDEQGRRITTEYARDANGAPVINVFPRQQTSSSTPVHAEPDPFGPPTTAPGPTTEPGARGLSPPAVVIPRLATSSTTTTSTGATSTTTATPTSSTEAAPPSP